MSDLAAAHADVVLGPENKSLRGSDAEKRATAVHEAGHTIVSVFTPAATPPRQVTVVPRKVLYSLVFQRCVSHGVFLEERAWVHVQGREGSRV